jgi:6-pyruvoyl-tetrahydropterin synthase
MVVDFNDIKAVWRDIEPQLDHKHLNDSLQIVTTAENIAWWILSRFHASGVAVNKVRVWETATSMAEVDYAEVWANGNDGALLNGPEVVKTETISG